MPSHDHCCVPQCCNRRTKRADLGFHAFPCVESLRRSWIVAIKRDRGLQFQITKHTVVCSDHFRREDFTLPPDIKGESPGKKRRLKPGAVPSIFSFRQELPSRPSPADRRADALALNAALCLPQFGPQTELEATKAQLEVLRSRVREQDDI